MDTTNEEGELEAFYSFSVVLKVLRKKPIPRLDHSKQIRSFVLGLFLPYSATGSLGCKEKHGILENQTKKETVPMMLHKMFERRRLPDKSIESDLNSEGMLWVSTSKQPNSTVKPEVHRFSYCNEPAPTEDAKPWKIATSIVVLSKCRLNQLSSMMLVTNYWSHNSLEVVVAYHFTGSSFNKKGVAHITSDMGLCNEGV
ncbi:unnamed protein product [Lepeophtheirus salmonis]|uniref:(salmon louse) hypothetical protein n=1 Tax=Lepeophtheirus salmonis TaxID=72036 RepID=A0A7R8CXR1_LEPSM|nr:unnamed protein product [Lepeophtheirus salmonis]CAF2934342.1 unnamed protein product [Lepeophtheirus salmonis]